MTAALGTCLMPHVPRATLCDWWKRWFSPWAGLTGSTTGLRRLTISEEGEEPLGGLVALVGDDGGHDEAAASGGDTAGHRAGGLDPEGGDFATQTTASLGVHPALRRSPWSVPSST